MCDFACKSCFIHWDLAEETLSSKTTSTSQGTISLKGTVLQALTMESACILKTTPGSSPWNIYRILILKQCGRGFSRPDYRVACRLFSRGVIFTRARVSLALLSLRKNGGLLVVYDGVPQGTKLVLSLFLRVPRLDIWKYVDGTIIPFFEEPNQ